MQQPLSSVEMARAHSWNTRAQSQVPHTLLFTFRTPERKKSRERAEVVVVGGGSCRSWLLALECLPHGLPGDAGGEVRSTAPCLLYDLWPAGSHRRPCTAARASTFHECSRCYCVSLCFLIPSSSLDYPFLTFLQTSVLAIRFFFSTWNPLASG